MTKEELLESYAKGVRDFRVIAIPFGTDLSHAILSEANFSGADLRWADLSWADLSWADLRGVNLIGADLFGASLINALIDEENKRLALAAGAIFD